jgi:hypothetical protein
MSRRRGHLPSSISAPKHAAASSPAPEHAITSKCHTIDVMHVEKNMCEILVCTLLDIPSKAKDTLNARMGIDDMKVRKDLHHKILENGSKKLPTTCYSLSKYEKMSATTCMKLNF